MYIYMYMYGTSIHTARICHACMGTMDALHMLWLLQGAWSGAGLHAGGLYILFSDF